MLMRHIVVCALPHSTLFFPHYLINGTIFGKGLLNPKCVFWFSVQLLSETFLIVRWTERDMIKNVYRSSCKVPHILHQMWRYLNLDSFLKIFIYQISWESVQWEPSCYKRTDGKNKTKRTVAFRDFPHAPENKTVHDKSAQHLLHAATTQCAHRRRSFIKS